MNPRYPIYIPSKGRSDSRKTVKALDLIGVPYRVVVEPQQFDDYAAVIDPAKLLVLPHSDKGLHVTRNWIWEHSLSEGHDWHWQIDDNISGFFRLHRNLKTPVADGTIFYVAEEFVGRYESIAQAGFNYFMFASRKTKIPPFYLNTRIYSCTLNRNDLPFRYRSFFNDDTDLSLQMLKAGWATVLFNAFLAFKETTMTVKGGLTDHYQGEGRLKMAQALVDLHPDVTTITWRWGRWQHLVDYRPFRFNKLRRRPGIEIPDEPNNFGMRLERLVDGEWIPA